MVRIIFASMQLVPYVACNFLKNFQAGKWKYDKWYDKYQSNLNCSLINWKNGKRAAELARCTHDFICFPNAALVLFMPEPP